ncbi:membrane protein involved in the export of O-antigen and teichoic acid [Burkholderiales bacterium JOSHI_001]|nr:membrane protein involved in the export of O-antigen and teichoic acid [Burkholderiales bacterium JOSHI_001]
MLGGRRGGALIAATAVASAGLSLLSQVLAERALGAAGFAHWSHLNALLLLAVPLGCLGSNHLLLSEHARGRLQHRAGLMSALRFYGMCLAVSLPLFLLAGAWRLGDEDRFSTPLLALLFLGNALAVLLFPVFQISSRATAVALWPLAQVSLRALAGALALALTWSASTLAWAWGLGLVLLGAVGLVSVMPLARQWASEPQAATAPPSQASLLRQAGVFGASDMLDTLDLKLIIPLAALWHGSAATAAAGIVVVMLSAVVFLPSVLVSRVLLPAVHREGLQSPTLRHWVTRVSAAAAVGLLPVAAALGGWGPDLVAAVARGNYAAQSDAFRLVGLCLLPLSLSMLGAAPFMAHREAARLLRWRLEALAVFLVLAVVIRDHGLASLLWAMAGGRLWLTLRTLTTLYRAKAP